MDKRSKLAALAALVGAGLLTFGVVGAALASQDKVDICHATSSESHPYTSANASKTADAGGHAGHTGGLFPTPGWGDIIPEFAIDGGGTFPGLNNTVDGLAILANGCKVPGESDAPPTDAPTLVVTPVITGEPATDSAIGTTGSSGPTDTAWLLVVGLGVLLASIVVLTPARAKRQR